MVGQIRDYYYRAVIGEEPKVRKLLTGINDISFEFYDGKQWNQTYEGSDLPLAIAVELDTKEFGLIKRKFLVAGLVPKEKVN